MAVATKTKNTTHTKMSFMTFLKRNASLRSLNKILLLVVVLLIAFLAFCIVAEAAKLGRIDHFIGAMETQVLKNSSVVAGAHTGPSGPVSLDPQLNNRDIFQPAPPIVKDEPSDGAAYYSVADNYRLVGIAESDNVKNSYIMIENLQTQMTYFLAFGEKVEDMELQQILDDRVIVNIGGENVELE